MLDLTQKRENQRTYIGKNKGVIQSVLYFPKLRTLIAGDKSGHLMQYYVNPLDKSWGRTKDYGDGGIGEITCSCQFKHLAFFGAEKGNANLIIINIQKQKVVGTVSTLIYSMYSLEICRVPGPRAFVTVSGYKDRLEWRGKHLLNKKDVFELSPSIVKEEEQEPFQGKRKLSKELHGGVTKILIINSKISTLKRIVENLNSQLKNNNTEMLIVNALMSEINYEKHTLQKIMDNRGSHFKKEKPLKCIGKKMKMDQRGFEYHIKEDVDYEPFKKSGKDLMCVNNWGNEFDTIKKEIREK
jgi:hypothetical protein